ncbi:hypothetical protein OCOL_000940 [Ordospora colligata]|uniref:DNA-directed RNA polymerase III subunit RPC3 n=1 Tax=Ordospora colligata OC4 TaxID=1354746 RepID=A0A0B2UFJ0_9MICR|nr:uncharacterized protein M896_040230 [Ordospora colligata OC4]KHN69831.1 hypothetical protein M896_040230 [Ordospora colligata OC4]TBU16001.1 hypothetical protein CWI41_040230 [Ordospora colligata]TBU16214.1 hypothetical protein CWI40_040230 [Ordospora colligata]
MPKLVDELLADYGTIPQKIGNFLMKKNESTSKSISSNTSLSNNQVINGLSFLIQRRFVRYFVYEKEVYYSLAKEMIYRRLLYSTYYCAVEDMFGPDITNRFVEILIAGFVEIECNTAAQDAIQSLVDEGIVCMLGKKEASLFSMGSRCIVKNASKCTDDENDVSVSKKNKVLNGKVFVMVDFDVLDSIVARNKMQRFIQRKYLRKSKDIYASILKCNLVTIDAVMGNLDQSICFDISRSDVISCIKYFCNSGLLKKSMDGSDMYFRDVDEERKILIIDCFCRILTNTNKHALRLFNMMIHHKELEDKDIALKSLICARSVKKALMMLHSNGFVNLKHLSSSESRPVLQWQVDIGRSSKIVGEKIRKVLGEILSSINIKWHVMRPDDEANADEVMQLKSLHNLSADLFVIGL